MKSHSRHDFQKFFKKQKKVFTVRMCGYQGRQWQTETYLTENIHGSIV